MAITQDTRRLKVSSPLGDDVLILTSLSASERISGLFAFDCTFASEREDVNFDDIIGQGVGLELEMSGGETRYFHGVWRRSPSPTPRAPTSSIRRSSCRGCGS